MKFDEFELLPAKAAEHGLPWTGPPLVRREFVDTTEGRQVSALVWGDGDPEVVLLHGGAQNAHSWDSLALALDRPLIAVDLPGHGRSSWRPDRDYLPVRNAEAIASAVAALAPRARVVAGFSIGGLTAIRLAAVRSDLVRRLVVVEVTPGATAGKPPSVPPPAPETFGSFDELLERRMGVSPAQSAGSLRQEVLQNVRPLPDGRWTWHCDRLWPLSGEIDFARLWTDLAAVTVPVMLVCGARSGAVTKKDRAQFQRLRPQARIERMDGAGHSLNIDHPVELAALIDDFACQP